MRGIFLQSLKLRRFIMPNVLSGSREQGRKHQANVKTARLYISHFIQVLNLAVIRSEVRNAHKILRFPEQANNVPGFINRACLWQSGGVKSWMEKNKRISQGGNSHL